MQNTLFFDRKGQKNLLGKIEPYFLEGEKDKHHNSHLACKLNEGELFLN